MSDMPDVEKLALQFVCEMRASLSASECEEIDRENRRRGDDTCASHDYCDANMVMDAAWRQLGYGDVLDREGDEWVKVWNAAWDRAQEIGFGPRGANDNAA